ncbi:MAG: serine/threonine-protein kinase [Terriglobia bacterium]
MVKCNSCGVQVSDAARFCASCGAVIVSGLDATAGATAAEPLPAPSPRPAPGPGSKPRVAASGPSDFGVPRSSSPSSGLSSEGRFLPGTLLAGRYRIVAVLGKGGMGEVYRADDLTLGQPVALKFLPEAAATDVATLERFRNEVRTARRVSHSNVCRVYDVGEVEGQTFLSMEYVDGEDLASLLRRIGRLPGDKALEIARQLCAGLAAAHREGILHRDLKPANVMLDGRGRAVMTDFGLAGFADRITGHDVRSGTPAYMAPEQLAGREVTIHSDIYSLGLVLYEIFTGKRAYDADKLPDLVRLRNEKPPSSPSTLVKDIDPAVERVILRCLEPDPNHRPASALAVAAALPGGDPLAAALAAGETPSPQMVAAAGETEGIAPRTAVAGLAAVIAGLVITVAIGLHVSGLRMMDSPLPPEVLALKAQEIVKSLGYSGQAVDHASHFYYNTDFTDYVHSHDLPRPNWPKVLTERPEVLRYVYRMSPVYLDPSGFRNLALTPGVVTFDDPPPTDSGMITVTLDSQGRLVYLQAIPKEVEPNPPPATPLDWKPLFTAAGLDPAQFHAAEPQWLSLAAFDARAAWTGVWPGSGRPLRVEAAAWRGKPVFFDLVGPWTTPDRTEYSTLTRAQHAAQILSITLAILLLTGGALLARRNYKKGNIDLQGALRLASAVLMIEVANWVCEDHFIPTWATFGRFVLALSTGLFISGAIWMLYLALEPYVRRRWPQAIISWSRLMAGRWRDPQVGRDVLWGVLLGVVWCLVVSVGFLVLKREGATPQLANTSLLLGMREVMGNWLLNVVQCIVGTLEFFFILFLLRVVLRNQWLAAAAFVVVFAAQNTLAGDHPQITVWIWLVVFSIAAYAVSRFGLIVLATALFTANVLLNVPFTLDASNWYATGSFALLLSFVALAAWGFHTSLGGQRLWKGDLFE